jgi:hypothetical protein
MRHLIASLVVGVAIWTSSADQPFPPLRLDAPVEGAFTVADPVASGVCGFWRTIEQIARRTQIRVGFQNSAGCAPGGAGLDPTERAIDLQGSSPRAAFDHVVNLRTEFSWRAVDGVVVIRPVSGWDAPTDALSRPVTPFRIENAHPHHALHSMLENTQPVMFQRHTDLQLSSLGRRRFDSSATGVIDKLITVQFGGGSLLNALNSIAEPFHGIWQVGYTGTFMHIEMRTLDFQEGSTHITARVTP